LLELIADYKRLQAQVNALAEQRRDKDVTPNESARLRMEMRRAQRQRDGTLSDIRDMSTTEHGEEK
jgi:hypothetical protein